jgi:hypothetical protein
LRTCVIAYACQLFRTLCSILWTCLSCERKAIRSAMLKQDRGRSRPHHKIRGTGCGRGMGEREGSPSQGRPQDRLRASGAIFLYHASRDTGDGIRDTGDGRRETEDGRRETEGGRRETGGGRRDTGDGRRETGYGRRETEYGRRVRGDGRRETDDGRRETGDGRRETGEKEKTTASKSSRILCFNAQAGARRTGKYFISRANGNIKKIFF